MKNEMKKSIILALIISLLVSIHSACAVCNNPWGCPGEESSSKCPTCHCPTCGPPAPLISAADLEEPIRPDNINYTHPEYITYADELNSIIKSKNDRYIVIDVRPPEKYSKEHIPNAINIPWYELSNLSKASEILGNNGVSNGKKIIVYSDSCKECGGMGVAAYVFWLFNYLGYKDVSLLDGGIDAWKKLYNTTNTSYTLPKAKFNASLNPNVFADVNWVESHLNDPNVQIVDARTKDEYDAGHIPNAINIDYNSLMRGEDRLKGADVLNYLFTGKGLDKSKEILVYCKGGIRSSYMYFALVTMGYKVRNYIGGWTDWIKSHPVPKIEITDYGLSATKVYKGASVDVFAKVNYVVPVKASFCPACGSDIVNIPAMISKPKNFDVKAYVKQGDSIKTVAVMNDNGNSVFTGKIYTLSLDPGDYTVEIVASKNGLKSSVNAGILQVMVDNAPPELVNVNVIPKNPSFGQRVKIVAEIKDSSRVTAYALINNNGREVARVILANKNGNYVGYWYVTVKRGNYTIDIVATDSNGNSATFLNVARLSVTAMQSLKSFKIGFW